MENYRTDNNVETSSKNIVCALGCSIYKRDVVGSGERGYSNVASQRECRRLGVIANNTGSGNEISEGAEYYPSKTFYLVRAMS